MLVEAVSVLAAHDTMYLYFDHGHRSEAVAIAQNVTIIFSGPRAKTDDDIVRDLTHFFVDDCVSVVTSDSGLAARCRRKARRRLDIIDSRRWFSAALKNLCEGIERKDDDYEISTEDTLALQAVANRAAALNGAKLRRLESPVSLEEVSHLPLRAFQDAIRRAGGGRLGRELTWERILLAAKLRTSLKIFPGHSHNDAYIQFVQQENNKTRVLAEKKKSKQRRPLHLNSALKRRPRIEMPPLGVPLPDVGSKDIQLLFHDKKINDATLQIRGGDIEIKQLQIQSLINTSKLRLTVCSDTHGMEKQLGDTIGTGDLLIHCGDFALDAGGARTRNSGLLAFDTWLFHQQYALKIVCRGNHDPFRAKLHNAEYLTRATLLNINNGTLRILCLPHGTYATDLSTVVPSPDVVITHHPPRGLLDTTYQKKHAGSIPLRTALETKNGALNSSRLWLFGHIHEAAGAARQDDTVFINAANANPGRATRLVRPYLTLNLDTRRKKRSLSPLVTQEKIIVPTDTSLSTPGILIALDLGLKNIGAAAFSLKTSQLLAYAAADTVVSAVRGLSLDRTENVTLVTEGTDRALRDDALSKLLESGLLLNHESGAHLIAADHWRKQVLLPGERNSKHQAKHAARLIARQIIYNLATSQADKPLTTDAAEAICFGAWAVRELIQSSASPDVTNSKLPPLVSRYTNGKIVLPPSPASISSSSYQQRVR